MSEFDPKAVEADETAKLAPLQERALAMLSEASDLPALEAGYRAEAAKHADGKPVRVIYVSSARSHHFIAAS